MVWFWSRQNRQAQKDADDRFAQAMLGVQQTTKEIEKLREKLREIRYALEAAEADSKTTRQDEQRQSPPGFAVAAVPAVR